MGSTYLPQISWFFGLWITVLGLSLDSLKLKMKTNEKDINIEESFVI